MSSILLTLDSNSGSTHNFTTLISNLVLDASKTYEVGLVSGSCIYSFYNISDTQFGNAKFKYYNGTSWSATLTLPDGLMSVDTIEEQMRILIEGAGGTPTNISLVPSYSNSKITLVCSNSYGLDLQSSLSSLHSILGFNSGLYSSASQEGQNIANINNGVSSLQIHCSIANGAYHNGQKGDVIHQFIMSGSPSSFQELGLYQPIYCGISSKYQINQIRMYITDQDGNLIDFNGQPVSYMLHIREAK